MEKIIKEIYEKKLSDGTFEKIVSDNFEKMVNDTCNSLFTWQGPIKKQMEEKIKEIMGGVIEGTNFNDYVVKLTTVINESLNNTPLSEYKEIAKKIAEITDVPDIKLEEEVNVSYILSKYVEYIENHFDESDFDESEIDTDEGEKTACVECQLSVDDVEEDKGYFYSNRERKIVTLSNDKDDDHPETVIQFHLEKTYRGKWRVSIDKNFRISDIRTLPSFVIYLLTLEQRWADIKIDSDDSAMDADLSFEWEYS